MDINEKDLKKIAKEIAQSSPDIVFYVLYNEKTGDITWEEFVDTNSRVDMDEDWLFIGRYRGRRGQNCTQTAIRQEIVEAATAKTEKEDWLVFLTADTTNGVLQWKDEKGFDNPPEMVDDFVWALDHIGDDDFIGGWLAKNSEEYQDIKDRYGIEVKEERS